MLRPLHNPAHADVSSTSDSSPAVGEFSSLERNALLRIAHQAIESAVEDRDFVPAPPSERLSEPRGVFTTLYRGRDLRGCVGYIAAVVPLYIAVAETARAAAFEDTRFLPVKRSDAYDLKVSLSVLSPVAPIDPEHVLVGHHGLVITQYGHRGLLLPQVATEHGWDRVTFLEQTCCKAGLPPHAWKQGARVDAFTAEVFADPDVSI